jgi:hypothetical protein
MPCITTAIPGVHKHESARHSGSESTIEPARYYSPGLLHESLRSFRQGSGDAGGFEPGVVVVPSGAGLVAAPPS